MQSKKRIFKLIAPITLLMLLISLVTFAFAATNQSASFSTIIGYDVKTVVVTLDPTTGDLLGPNQVVVTYGVPYTLTQAEKTGYAFNGWFSDAVDGTKYTDDTGDSLSNWNESEDRTLYAQWTANEYVVVFDANTGTGSMDNQTFVYDTPQNLYANAFEKIGHNFGGWSTTAIGTSIYDDEALVQNLATYGTTYLYAVWVPIDYTLTLNENGGVLANGTQSSYTLPYGTETLINNPTRDGYVFDGWVAEHNTGHWNYGIMDPLTNQPFVDSDGNEIAGVGGQQQILDPTILSANYSQYAVGFATGTTTYPISGNAITGGRYATVTRISYTDVSYGLGFHVGTLAQVDSVYFIVIVARFPVDWTINTIGNSIGTGASYEYLTPREGTGDWETYVIKVTTGKYGTMMDFGHTYITNTNSATNGTHPTFDLSGYYSYKSDIQTNVNSNYVIGGNETLTASWKTQANQITINANEFGTYNVSASNLFDNTLSTVRRGYAIEQKTPTWGGSSQTVVNASKFVSAHVRVHTGATYRITGATAGGFVEWKSDGYLTSYDHNLYSQATAYTNGAVIEIPTTYVNYSTGLDTPVTYTYMRFDGLLADIANIKLEMLPFSATGTTSFNMITNASVTVVATANTGYIASVTKKSGSGTFSAGTLSAITGAADIDVKFTARTTTVTLNKANGTGGTNSVTATYNANMPAATAPARTGYTFGGYYDGENGAGTQYYTSTMASARTWNKTASTATLYAKWTANTYTVVFNANTGSGTMTNQVFTYDVAKALTSNAFTKTGYGFAGWATSSGGAVVYTNGQSVSNLAVSGTLNLYAKWTAGTYTIVRNTQGGSAMADYTVTYDTAYNLGVPTKAGYTFTGWFSATTAGTAYTDNTGASLANWTETAGRTLYAQWTANTYTIVRNGNGGANQPNINVTYNSPYNLSTTTRTGYTFTGWFSATTAGTRYTSNTGASSANWTETAGRTLYAQWTANTYTVVFNANTGSGTMSNQSFTYDVEKVLTANAFTKTGYSFAGWATSAGGDVIYTNGQSVSNLATSGTFNLYAKWTATTTTVTLDRQSGTGGSTSVVATYDAAMPTATAPARTGYTFGGYYDSENGAGTQYYTNTMASARTWNKTASTFTLYAKWTPTTTTITLDRQSGTDGSTSVVATYDSAMPSATAPTRVGYTFGGYYSATGGGGTQYYTSAMASARTWNQTASTFTLYAKWTADTFTIVRNGNGGTTLANFTVTYGESYNLGTTTRTGYTFTGWFSATTAGTRYTSNTGASSANWTETAGRTLYAQWTANTYNIVFNANTGTGTMTNQTFTYNVAQTLTSNAFTKTGYGFAGWATSSGGAVVYTNGQSVSNLATSGNFNLYAKWTATTTTVTLNVQSGTGGTTSVVATYGANMPTATAPTRTGYTFGGYYSATGGGGTQYYTAAMASSRTWNQTATTYTLYANWKANTTTVTLNVQSGTGGTASVTATYGANMPTATAPTRTGYTFGGYYSATGGGGTQYYTSTMASATAWNQTASTFTLYAKWTGTSTTVTLDRQSGTSGSTSVTATYGSNMPAATAPTRTGYTFGGYYSATGGGGTQYYTSTMTSARTWNQTASTFTLYAKWTATTTTITLDRQSGTSGSTSVTATYGSNMPAATAPTRTGYTFGGYYSATGGGGTQYYTSTMASARTWNQTASTFTLYAKWTANTYTIVRNGNGGTSLANFTVTYNAAYNLSTTTRSGYTFTGWFSATTGGTRYTTNTGASSANWTETAGRTLYAQWTANTYTIVRNVNGGDSAMTDYTVTFGAAYNLGVPTRENYIFDGWFSATSGGTRYTTSTGASSANWSEAAGRTLYAQWLRNNGSGTESNPYRIYEAGAYSESAVAGSFNHYAYNGLFCINPFYYILMNNISLTNESFEFMGTFNGNEKTITVSGRALFDTIIEASIKDLTVHSTNVVSYGYGTETHAAIFAQKNYKNSTLTNITITGNMGTSDSPISAKYVGGVVASSTYGNLTLNNVHNNATIYVSMPDTNHYTGGLVGYYASPIGYYASPTLSIINSSNTANIIDSDTTVWGNIGGLVGSSDQSATIQNSFNSGNVSLFDARTIKVGGLIGSSTSNNTIITSSYNTGNIIASISYSETSLGGLMGYGGITATSSYNLGKIQGYNAGGIIGYSSSIYFTNCYNKGTISGTYSGGMAGNISAYGAWGLYINHCFNQGDVTGDIYAGGLVGYLYIDTSTSSIDYFYNTGTIFSRSYAGGFIGYNISMMGTTNISFAYNFGSVVSSDYAGGITGFESAGNGSHSYSLTQVYFAPDKVALSRFAGNVSKQDESSYYIYGEYHPIISENMQLAAGYAPGFHGSIGATSGFVWAANGLVIVDGAEIIISLPRLYYETNYSGSFTITYDINGASGTTPTNSTSYAQGATVALHSGSGLTKTGYVFMGWSTSSSALKGLTGSVALRPYQSAITLYAVWSNYTIVSFSGSAGVYYPYTKEIYNGQSYQMPVPVREGYAFSGWYNNYVGSVAYTNSSGASLSNWNSTADTATFCAVWTMVYGSGTESDPYYIHTGGSYSSSAAQGSFNYHAYHGYFNSYTANHYKLVANINMSSTNFYRIAFNNGSFDGNGHTITTTNRGALFTSVGENHMTTIKNLTIVNTSLGLSDSSYMAGLATYAYRANIVNVTVSGSAQFTPHNGAGAFFARAEVGSTYITDSTNNMNLLTGSSTTGGFIGTISDVTVHFTNCVNNGNISVSSIGVSSAGGLIGAISGSTTLTIYSSHNTGTISAGSSAGGLVGYSNATVNFNNCYNLGSIKLSYGSGGSLDSAYSGFSAYNSYNKGSINNTSSSSYGTGGLMGSAYSGFSAYNSYNKGSVTTDRGSDTVAGGLLGYASVNSSFNRCYNTGNVSAPNKAGGFLGQAGMTLTVTNSYNTGTITNTSSSSSPSAGGFVGYLANSSNSTFTNSFNLGTVGNSNTYYAGGFIGRVNEGYFTILRSYNSGTVTGGNASGSNLGGFVGYMFTDTYDSNINYSYNTGRIASTTSSMGTNVGGFIGYHAVIYSTFRSTHSYNIGQLSSTTAGVKWIGAIIGNDLNGYGFSFNSLQFVTGKGATQAVGNRTSAGATGRTYAAMQVQSNYTSWSWSGTEANPWTWKANTAITIDGTSTTASLPRLYWEASQVIEFSVGYELSGGSGMVMGESVNYSQGDNTVELDNGSGISKEGYKFAGWGLSPGATGGLSGTLYDINSSSEHLTLYAIWEAEHSVELNANGGNVGQTELPVIAGEHYLAPIPARTGYLFNGWFTATKGGVQMTGSDGVSLDVWQESEIIVFHAQWTKTAVYTLNFNANGGSGDMASQVFTATIGMEISYNLFYREGYVFLGWATSENGEVVYQNAKIVTLVKNTTLYAIWQQG